MAFFLLSAVEFLRNAPEGTYDAIIVDSSDPIGELMLLALSFLNTKPWKVLTLSFLLYICSAHFGFLASYYIIPELHASLFLVYHIPSYSALLINNIFRFYLQTELCSIKFSFKCYCSYLCYSWHLQGLLRNLWRSLFLIQLLEPWGLVEFFVIKLRVCGCIHIWFRICFQFAMRLSRVLCTMPGLVSQHTRGSSHSLLSILLIFIVFFTFWLYLILI